MGTFFNIPSTKMAEPIRVVVTGAAGQIAYSLLYQLAKGDVFGADQPLSLHLLDIEPMMGVLGGVVMELQDCALPLLREVIPTADPAVGFKDVDAAFLVGAMPRREGMERKDLLAANVSAMTRLDQNRAQAQIANRLGVAVNQVSQVTIWGNHSSTQFPDARHAKVCIDGVQKPVYEA